MGSGFLFLVLMVKNFDVFGKPFILQTHPRNPFVKKHNG